MREALLAMRDENYVFNHMITGEDFDMGSNIVEHSVKTSFALMNDSVSKPSPGMKLKEMKTYKQPIPEPVNMTMDFLIPYTNFVNRICSEDKISLSVISRDNIYPVINKEKGAEVAVKFVKGLCQFRFGKIMNEKTKCFKRYHPYDIDCPDKENLESKW